MKKTFISVSILFFAAFGALGQSVTIQPSNFEQLKVRGYDASVPYFSGFRSKGTASAPTAILSGDNLATFSGTGYTGLGFPSVENVSIRFFASQNFNSVNTGTNIKFLTTPNNTTTQLERMVINHDGFVGIGTNTPTSRLQVNTPTANYGLTHTDGTIRLSSYINTPTGAWMGTESFHPFLLYTGNKITPGIQIQTDNRVVVNGTDAGTGTLQIRQIGGNGITIYGGDNAHRWEIATDFGSATAGAGGDLGFFHNGTIKSEIDRVTGVIVLGSDRRLKKNIEPLENVLEKVMKLKPSTYQYIADNPTGIVSMGLIAQEVEPLFPVFVHQAQNKEGKDLKMLDYSSMSVLALKAIQEQQVIIEKLQTENSALKTENKAFESRLATIENLVSRIGESKKTVGEK